MAGHRRRQPASDHISLTVSNFLAFLHLSTSYTAIRATMSATKRLQTIQSHLSTASGSGSGSSSAAAPEIKVVAVYGAGLMGAGIAQVAAFSGYDVYLWDVNDKALE